MAVDRRCIWIVNLTIIVIGFRMKNVQQVVSSMRAGTVAIFIPGKVEWRELQRVVSVSIVNTLIVQRDMNS